MESLTNKFRCREHPDEQITLATYDTSFPNSLFCVKCVKENKTPPGVVLLADYFSQYQELNHSLPNLAGNELCIEINEALKQESKIMAMLTTHLEAEKTRVNRAFENLIKDLSGTIDSLKKEALAKLDKQLILLQANFSFLHEQSDILNGVSNETSFPLNLSTLTSENDLHNVIKKINRQIEKRKALSKSKSPDKLIQTFEKSIRDNLGKLSSFTTEPLPKCNLDEKFIETPTYFQFKQQFFQQIQKKTGLSNSLETLRLYPLTTFSNIITSLEEEDLISQWISKESPVKFNLMYQGSKDGFSAKDFHRLCDKVPSLLVIIKSTNDSTFGGYTGQPFGTPEFASEVNKESRSNLKLMDETAPQTFLFNLNSKEIYIPNENSSSISTSPSSGPIFGQGDLQISDNCNTTLSHSILNTYAGIQPRLETKVVKSLCKDSASFYVKEIEAYEVILGSSVEEKIFDSHPKKHELSQQWLLERKAHEVSKESDKRLQQDVETLRELLNAERNPVVNPIALKHLKPVSQSFCLFGEERTDSENMNTQKEDDSDEREFQDHDKDGSDDDDYDYDESEIKALEENNAWSYRFS